MWTIKQTENYIDNRLVAIRDGVEEMREGGQRVQTSSYEMRECWKRDVLHACCCLVAQSGCPTLQPHGLQNARLP